MRVVEYVLCWHGGEWTSEDHEVPADYDALEWFQVHLLEKNAYREIVHWSVVSDNEVDDADLRAGSYHASAEYQDAEGSSDGA